MTREPMSRYVLQRAILAFAVAGTLVGCTRSADELRAERAARGARAASDAPTTDAASPSLAVDPDMVAAVSNAGSATPIDFKFRLQNRPEVGKPLRVDMVLVPDRNARIARIHLSFQGGDGLKIEGANGLDIDEAAAAALVKHELTVMPQQPGVLALIVTALVDTDSASIARTYTIPVIAAEPAG